MSFGKRLKKLREDKEMTQRQLAEILGIGASTLAMYEIDKRSPDHNMLLKLANYFNVSTDYLLGRTDEPSPKDDVRQHVNDDDALEYLDELHKRPEMKTLFQVGRKATKEDIETAITIIEALKKKGGKEDE